jgi:hypothetical protein
MNKARITYLSLIIIALITAQSSNLKKNSKIRLPDEIYQMFFSVVDSRGQLNVFGRTANAVMVLVKSGNS